LSEIRATLNLEQDGSALPDMPAIRRLIFAETSGVINEVYPPDNNSTSFHPVVQATMPNLGFIYIATDQTINIQLNGSATAFPLLAGCEMLLFGTQLTQGTPSNNIEINNPALTGGVTANVTIVLAGS
jgi:hypothetical protein